jgi:hypothetical protein
VYGCYVDDRVAEIILDGADAVSGQLATLLLQRGNEIEHVRSVVDDDSLLAAVCDRLMAINGGPRSPAFRWLSKVSRRRTLNRRLSTGMLKHQCEADEGEYVSVESFNKAALALGFKLQFVRRTNAAFINIAEPRQGRRRYSR